MRLVSDPQKVERHYAKVVARCPADRELLERPVVRRMSMENPADANRRGLDGFAGNGRVHARTIAARAAGGSEQSAPSLRGIGPMPGSRTF